jgi:3-dehydroquinate synthase
MSETAERIHIDLGPRSYDILVGPGVLDAEDSFDGLPIGGTAVIVTNTTVGPLMADRLAARLRQRFKQVHVVLLEDGERHKDWPTMSRIFDAMLEAQCDRRTVLFALGGGVVGDITGFAAACYMRGVAYVQVPTTLLAQVDSSVGGKTAINHPLGKNMVGAFHQPVRVLADTGTLDTLPAREFIAGLGEVIKYGPIADYDFFEWIETHLDRLLAREPGALRHAIRRSCEIKAQIVSSDERESGLREILNFGHTFGHAIEAGLGFGTWLHGEAIGCGMVMATELSTRLGLIESDYAKRIIAVVRRAGLPIYGPTTLSADRYLELMRIDKKALDGKIRFVLLDAPGHAMVRSTSDEAVRAAILAHTGE